MPVPAPSTSNLQDMIIRHTLCLLPLTLCLLLTLLFIGNGAELVAFYKAYRGAHPQLTQLVKLVTHWGNPLLYLVYAGILGYGIRKKEAGSIRFALCYLVFQLLFALILVRILKISFGMPRPYMDTGQMPFSMSSGQHSFPSGHTTEIVGASVPLATHYQQWGMTLLASMYICLVGYSRIYLGMHHPGDLVAGMALGSITAIAIYHYTQTMYFQSFIKKLAQ